ncbi:hypothetical protein G7Z17_g2590 [Cylindrodendrum hubeiense]|uniref:Peptide hydrolase n=1 Tax=Cylindrodendrum hubeiense TaxID=595255 RepID=A0A9P5HDZ9_9HYPO|nr:hypothetical protein G7Z17_g2590 [Cylindrodendrum hubeiense]
MKFATATALFALLAPFTEAGKDRKPIVKSSKLQKHITEKGLMKNLRKLNDIAYDNGGNRAFGLPGYDASVDFIYREVSKLKGFTAWKQDFPGLYTETLAAEVSVDGEVFRTVALTYTPSTPEEGVTRELVHGPEGDAGCSVDNYAGLDVEDKIVLVERGLCPDATTFAGKLKAAAAAGAVAVVIYNSDSAKLTAGTLSAPNPDEYVPAALIDQEPGQALTARLTAGETVEVFVKIIQTIEERITHNVFAETKGGDGSNLIVLGAHLDSVKAGPGINDDGSGTSLILELAKALQNYSTKLKVRFGWWGAEENGLVGSRFYVNNLSTEEINDLLLYINFDMVSRGYYGVFDGTGEKIGPGGPPGSDVIEDLFIEYFTAKGLVVTPVGLTGGTDYVPFLNVINKPVGGLFTGTGLAQDACYHQACDNITNPVPETITVNAKAAAHVLSVLAVDGVKLIPKTPVNTTTATIRLEPRLAGNTSTLTQREAPYSSSSAHDLSGTDADPVLEASRLADSTVPDGGRGWVVIAACAVVAWWFVGTSYSWGIIQDALVTEGIGSPSTLAFVGSLSTALISALAIINARVIRWMGSQRTAMLGVSFLGLSAITSSFAVKNIAGLFFTSGILLGLGLSLCFMTVSVTPAQYFNRKRGLANGIVFAGGGLGGAVTSYGLDALILKFGPAWTYRILGIATLVTGLPAAWFIQERTPIRTASLIEWRLFKDPAFALIFAVGAIGTFPLFVPPFFIPLYSRSMGLSSSTGAGLLAAFNFSSAVGRIICGHFCDIFGPLNTLMVSLMLTAISMLTLWPASTSLAPLAVFVVVNGASNGGFFATMPTVGAPIAGYLLESYGGADSGLQAYRPAMFYAGALALGATGLVAFMRFRTNQSLFVKV